MKKLAASAAILAAGFLVAFAAAELVLRLGGYSAPIWYQPDAKLGWSLRPGAQGWFTREGRVYAEINAEGFRDRAHPLAKPAGVYRIALLGDSVAEAFQVELRSSFWW